MVLHVPNVLSKIYSNFLNRLRSLLTYSVFRCSHCVVITLFKSAFMYLEYKILRIMRVSLTALLDSRHSSAYDLIHDSYGLTILAVIILKTCSSPRRTFFLHALSFECTTKMCITFLNQFLAYFHI